MLNQSALPSLSDFKLASIDLDGTLLGPNHQIGPENMSAIHRMQEAGIEIVLNSGRHYNSILPYSKQIPGSQWIISAQGSEVSSLDRKTILWRSLLPPETAIGLFKAGLQHGCTPFVYTVDGTYTCDIVGPDTEKNMAFYSELVGFRPDSISDEDILKSEVYKVLWASSPERMDPLTFDDRINTPGIQKVRTHPQFLEFFPEGVSKATGLARLTGKMGIAPQEVVCFGDAENDVPMFLWCGCSFGMPQGWPPAIEKARFISPDGPRESNFARAVAMLR